jgi:hypothetical protein
MLRQLGLLVVWGFVIQGCGTTRHFKNRGVTKGTRVGGTAGQSGTSGRGGTGMANGGVPASGGSKGMSPDDPRAGEAGLGEAGGSKDNGGEAASSGGEAASSGGEAASSGGEATSSGGERSSGGGEPAGSGGSTSAGKSGSGGSASVACTSDSAPRCNDDGAPETCVSGNWVAQSPCSGTTPVCGDGGCEKAVLVAGFLAVQAPKNEGSVKLVDPGFDSPAPLCGKVSGTAVCLLGGLRP